MIRLLRRLLQGERTEGTAMIDGLLDGTRENIRNADPDSQAQWLRLQRTLLQQAEKPKRAPARLVPRLALGTAVIAVAIVGAYVYFTHESPAREAFATGRGQQTRLVLQDSSEVTLNYATELVVQKLHPRKPRLLSLKGEAYFRVRHNETPFIISTGFAEVQVVGTEFNVRSRDEVLEVAVRRGVVKVSASRDGKDSSLTLTENEMAVCVQNEFPRSAGSMPSPEYPGWMEGKLFFNRTLFAAACRELEMRFDVTIRVEDRNVRDQVVTGMLSAGNADSAIAALCALGGKQFRHSRQEYVIY